MERAVQKSLVSSISDSNLRQAKRVETCIGPCCRLLQITDDRPFNLKFLNQLHLDAKSGTATRNAGQRLSSKPSKRQRQKQSGAVQFFFFLIIFSTFSF